MVSSPLIPLGLSCAFCKLGGTGVCLEVRPGEDGFSEPYPRSEFHGWVSGWESPPERGFSTSLGFVPLPLVETDVYTGTLQCCVYRANLH